MVDFRQTEIRQLPNLRGDPLQGEGGKEKKEAAVGEAVSGGRPKTITPTAR
tara:strand:- start:49267 stop:49419 length:153 start_codon:yes stop_codon:yes gene_type:complete